MSTPQPMSQIYVLCLYPQSLFQINVLFLRFCHVYDCHSLCSMSMPQPMSQIYVLCLYPQSIFQCTFSTFVPCLCHSLCSMPMPQPMSQIYVLCLYPQSIFQCTFSTFVPLYPQSPNLCLVFVSTVYIPNQCNFFYVSCLCAMSTLH